MRRSLAALSALAATISGGCGAEPASPDAGPALVAPQARREVTGRVVSTVDGAPITLEEVEEVARETGLTPLEALRRLQEERVLLARAEAAGLGDDEEVRDAVRRASVQALLEARVEGEVRPESVPAERIAERVESQRARWSQPERRRTTHVLARLEPGAPPEADAAAQRFARRAVERLRMAADPVAEAEALRAEDDGRRTYRVVVESLPPFARDGRLVPEFLAATFSLAEPGVVPEPVRTRFGWHAIVVTEILPPWEAPPEEIEEAVREELVVELRAERLDELTRELAARTRVVRDEAAITRALEADLEAAAEGGGGAAP